VDHDCRLGVKKSSNQVQPDGSKKVKKVSLFGYGTGVAACTDPATIHPFPSLQEFPPAVYPRYHDVQT